MHTDKVAYQVSSQLHNDLPHMAILNANDFNFLYGEKESLFFLFVIIIPLQHYNRLQ